MKSRILLLTAVVCLLAFGASAATIVVPAAGTGPGANNSNWQSDLTLHSVAPREIALSVSFHRGTEVFGPIPVTLAARQTAQFRDIVKEEFNLASGTGALLIDVADKDLKSLAVTSRTYNVTTVDGETREFGQDIPAVKLTDAAAPGDIAALSNDATDAATFRFNFGIYASEAASVKWQLVRADGTVAATKDISYAAGEHAQYNGGITSAAFFNVTPQLNDNVHARIVSGRAIVYGSLINATGDPSFVPSARTREDILVQLIGVDLDENGSIDIADADKDGVLDAAVDIYTSTFPSFFRIVAAGEFGEAVTLQLVSPTADTTLLDNGTLRIAAAGGLKGTTGSIVVRATTADGSTALLTIPVRYR